VLAAARGLPRLAAAERRDQGAGPAPLRARHPRGGPAASLQLLRAPARQGARSAVPVVRGRPRSAGRARRGRSRGDGARREGRGRRDLGHAGRHRPAALSRPLRRRDRRRRPRRGGSLLLQQDARRARCGAGRGVHRPAAGVSRGAHGRPADRDGLMPHHRPLDARELPRFSGIRTFMRTPHTRDLASVDAAVYGIPFDTATSYRTGARFGPEAIRSASALLRPYNPALDVNVVETLSIVDYGDVPVSPGDTQRTYGQIEEALTPLVAAGVFPLALGGDHSVTLAELRVLARKHGPARAPPARRARRHV